MAINKKIQFSIYHSKINFNNYPHHYLSIISQKSYKPSKRSILLPIIHLHGSIELPWVPSTWHTNFPSPTSSLLSSIKTSSIIHSGSAELPEDAALFQNIEVRERSPIFSVLWIRNGHLGQLVGDGEEKSRCSRGSQAATAKSGRCTRTGGHGE